MESTTREHRLLLKLRKQSIRVREKNHAETRLLGHRVHQLNSNCHRVQAFIDKEIKDIKDEIWRQEGVAEFNATPDDNEDDIELISLDIPVEKSFQMKRNRVKSAPILRSTGEMMFPRFGSDWRSYQADTKNEASHLCSYSGVSSVCFGFPCKLPKQYTNIGFDIRTDKQGRSNFSTANQVFAKAREGLVMELEMSSVRRPQVTSRDQTKNKISALRTIIQEMKVKSDKNKPKDWCTNYGKPISKRKLLKVARPASAVAFH